MERVDRLTKTLLALIAVALWGQLLRPLLMPRPAEAAPTQAGMSNKESGAPAITSKPNSSDLFVVQNGRVYQVSCNPLKIVDSVPLR